MILELDAIEELKNHFSSKILDGKALPNPKSVSDKTVFFKEESDGVYLEHVMFKGRWHKKVVDSNSQIILEQI
jgi:hypothetical protein